MAKASAPAFPATTAASQRLQEALQVRQNCAAVQCGLPPGSSLTNGDEALYPNLIGTFTKGLSHNGLGEVDPAGYAAFLKAMASGRHADFEQIPLGYTRKLVNPQGSFAYTLEGGDPYVFTLAPPPAIASAEAGAELVELYWQSAVRDVAFSDYDSSPIIQNAAAELSSLSGYKGPRDASGNVTTSNIFRGPTAGSLKGPFLSQYLMKPVPFFSGLMEQQYRVGMAGVDYVKTYASWLETQSGLPPYDVEMFDPTPRYIRNGRDLAQAVHYDHTYQFFTQAALIILDIRPETVLNFNVYQLSATNPYKTSRIQTGFTTFGPAMACCWLGNVTSAALKACWREKWAIHRRLRPDTFSGRVHNVLAGAASYPIDPGLLHSQALQYNLQQNGSALLSQAYLESSPIHPSYPAGHAVISGACVTVLKSLFAENALISGCYVPSSDGLSLIPADGLGLTIGGELEKLAFNIGMGRDFAGIHYRSDLVGGLLLGEAVAISFLQDQANTFTEDFSGFQFTSFLGTPVTVAPNQ